MRLNNTLLPLAALSPLVAAQSPYRPPLPYNGSSVTVNAIVTRTTSFTGAAASLGNVTLYIAEPTVVPADATAGLLPYNNVTQTVSVPKTATLTQVASGSIGPGATSTATVTGMPVVSGGQARSGLLGGALMGVAAGVAALI